jgi:hypothetical protein
MIARRATGRLRSRLASTKPRRRRLRQRAALDGRDMSHRTPAAVALRLTGERPGTAAMPSASPHIRKRIERAFGWSRQSRGKRRPLAHRRDGGHSDFLDRVEERRLTFQGKSDSESPFGALKGFLDMRYRAACAEFLILLRARSAGSLSGRCRIVESAECGVVTRSSREIPAPWYPVPEPSR